MIHRDSVPLKGENALTVTVRSLRAQSGGEEILVGILIEGGGNRESISLPITAAQYYALKLQKGVITQEQYDAIEEASRLCCAIRAGEHLLSYGANSKRVLAQKLMRKGFSRQVSDNAAVALADMGLINEDADVKREVEKCLAKLWGEKRISAHLWSKGFSAEALSELDALLTNVDFSENCAKMIRKHYGCVPEDPDEYRRMMASLSRYGYTVTQIREAVKLV